MGERIASWTGAASLRRALCARDGDGCLFEEVGERGWPGGVIEGGVREQRRSVDVRVGWGERGRGSVDSGLGASGRQGVGVEDSLLQGGERGWSVEQGGSVDGGCGRVLWTAGGLW